MSFKAFYQNTFVLNPSWHVSWTSDGQLHVNIQSLHHFSHGHLTQKPQRCGSPTVHRDEGCFTSSALLPPVWGKHPGTEVHCYHKHWGWDRWSRYLHSAQWDDGCVGGTEKWAATPERKWCSCKKYRVCVGYKMWVMYCIEWTVGDSQMEEILEQLEALKTGITRAWK